MNCYIEVSFNGGFTVYSNDKINYKLEGPKGVIKNRALKSRQYHFLKIKGKNDKRNITQTTKDWAIRTTHKTYELGVLRMGRRLQESIQGIDTQIPQLASLANKYTL